MQLRRLRDAFYAVIRTWATPKTTEREELKDGRWTFWLTGTTVLESREAREDGCEPIQAFEEVFLHAAYAALSPWRLSWGRLERAASLPGEPESSDRRIYLQALYIGR